jgi:hypothetical protein
MITRIYSVCCLLILLTLIVEPDNLAYASPVSKPKVLLFSAIDGEYLADSLEHWGNDVGVNGFMMANVADWWSTKNEIFKNLDLLKKINAQGQQYNIDSNFIKIALGHSQLPLWTDDKAWAGVLDNVKNIAELIKQSGTKGIALDTEPYEASLFDTKAVRFKSTNRDILKAKVYQRGKEIMQALTGVFPDIEVIILPEGSFYWFNPDQGSVASAYELWIDFFNGMASVKNKKGIVVAGERTFHVTDRNSLNKVYNMINNTMIEHVEDPVFWKERCSIALGMWPLGKEYDNKAAHYSPLVFKEQFSQAVTLSPKYVWIYGHGASWFQLKREEAEKYTKGGRLIWGKEYQILPTDPNINEYYSILRNYKNGH